MVLKLSIWNLWLKLFLSNKQKVYKNILSCEKMYELLRKDLKDHINLYDYIEGILQIHLGVGGKFELIRHLSRTNHALFEDLWYDTITHLLSMGYKSKKLEGYRKDMRLGEKNDVLHWVEAYKNEREIWHWVHENERERFIN